MFVEGENESFQFDNVSVRGDQNFTWNQIGLHFYANIMSQEMILYWLENDVHTDKTKILKIIVPGK